MKIPRLNNEKYLTIFSIIFLELTTKRLMLNGLSGQNLGHRRPFHPINYFGVVYLFLFRYHHLFFDYFGNIYRGQNKGIHGKAFRFRMQHATESTKAKAC